MKKLFPAERFVALRSLAHRHALEISFVLVITLFAGCAVLDSHQAKLDQKQLRDVLMDYNEDQILDNLIRAYNGRPIVHFDVRTVNATVGSRVTPNVGYGRTLTTNQLPGNSNAIKTTTSSGTSPTGPTSMVSTEITKTIGAVSAVVGTITEPFTSSLAAERTNSVVVEVKPQDERKIYAAYIKFLNSEQSEISEEPSASKKSKTSLKDPDEEDRDFETSKITKTNTKITESGASPPGTSPSPEASTTPTVTNATSKVTERVPAKQKDTGADLVVNAHKFREELLQSCLKERDVVRPLMQTPYKPDKRCSLVEPKLWNDLYYWVPVTYRKEFFELCVATVTKGASTVSAPEAAKIESNAKIKEDEDRIEDINTQLRTLQLRPP